MDGEQSALSSRPCEVNGTSVEAEFSTVWLDTPWSRRRGHAPPPPLRRGARPPPRAAAADRGRGEFSSHGFAGARVDEIAARGGVNKQLVYHYFDEQAGALSGRARIGLRRNPREGARAQPREPAAGKSDGKLIAFSFDYLAEHPEFIVLLTDENRNQGSHILGSGGCRRCTRHFRCVPKDARARAPKAGTFRRASTRSTLHLDRRHLVLLLLQQPHAVGDLRQGPVEPRPQGCARRRHVVDFVLHALRPYFDRRRSHTYLFQSSWLILHL